MIWNFFPNSPCQTVKTVGGHWWTATSLQEQCRNMNYIKVFLTPVQWLILGLYISSVCTDERMLSRDGTYERHFENHRLSSARRRIFIAWKCSFEENYCGLRGSGHAFDTFKRFKSSYFGTEKFLYGERGAKHSGTL